MPGRSRATSSRQPDPDEDLPPLPQRAVPELPDDEIPELAEEEPPQLPRDDIPELAEGDEPQLPSADTIADDTDLT